MTIPVNGRVKPGDKVRCECADGHGQRIDAWVAVERVERLGCGCDRLVTRRPNPLPGATHHGMHLHDATLCAWGHPSDVTALVPAKAGAR
mgnify:CR=1 FL=1